ncbi:MAG: helix-turn-helix transcriptional regulator [Alphaproteobacteria bacterium]|nr:helix-turn-helix transcriptional regulator [Alphaproteobacteria bacterium]
MPSPVILSEEDVSSEVMTVGQADARDHLGKLSPKETEIARLVSRGLPNKLIADTLGMSPNTVSTHLSRIYCKLRVRTRTQLAVRFVTEPQHHGSNGVRYQAEVPAD